MDEVLNYFSKSVVDRYNNNFRDDMDWRDNKSYWWKDCDKAEKSYFENLLLQPTIFYYSEPQVEAIYYMNKLIDEGYEVYIATQPQWHSQYCMNEKIAWIKKYIPKFNIDKYLYFCSDKSMLSAPGRILIDDNKKHLDEWTKKGGIAIAYDMPWNEDYKGIRVIDHRQVYETIKEIERVN